MKFFLLLATLLSSSVWANLHLAPPDFDTRYGRGVFVDFKSAQYDVTYDIENEVTVVKSKIFFEAQKTGKPLFDLVPIPSKIKLDGKKVTQNLISFPGSNSKLRQINFEVNPGVHTLEMENYYDTNVQFHTDWQKVSSAFWIRDLKDRMFLEQYVPSNFEYDQYQMTLNLNFLGVKKASQDIFTNGALTQTSPTTYQIIFPEYFTVSCPFFHTSPKGWMRRSDFTYLSISGREIPITVYSPWRSRTRRFKKESVRVMKELERDYGPWAHPSFVAYGTFIGTGGMEHSGATATSFKALDHEMLHSYFAKGVMPANGNSGWIDEAIASWRDKGYKRLPDPGFGGSDLGGHSVYKRSTDRRAYTLGSAFMGYLDFRLQDFGGLKAFLRGYFQTYKHMVVTTEHFKNNLEFFSGMDLDQEFGTYIWGKTTQDAIDLDTEENPHHVPLSVEDLRSLL